MLFSAIFFVPVLEDVRSAKSLISIGVIYSVVFPLKVHILRAIVSWNRCMKMCNDFFKKCLSWFYHLPMSFWSAPLYIKSGADQKPGLTWEDVVLYVTLRLLRYHAYQKLRFYFINTVNITTYMNVIFLELFC